jgi:hypothetical protein
MVFIILINHSCVSVKKTFLCLLVNRSCLCSVVCGFLLTFYGLFIYLRLYNLRKLSVWYQECLCGLLILWILSTLLLYAGSGNHIGTYRQDNCCYVPMLNKKVPLYSRQSQVANILKTPYHGA